MKLRRKKRTEENGDVTEVVVTQTDQVVLSMSGAAERLRALDAEMLSAFLEWRVAQQRCLEENLLVEVKMAEPLRAAYQTWLAEQYEGVVGNSPELPTTLPTTLTEAETGVIVTGAGEAHGHVHGWPMRMVPGQVTAW
jgi:hypothetical protein